MNIVVLTGAGISADSGIATFRAADGLWENHSIEDVASPEGFLRDPALVHRFYNLRRAQLNQVAPNEGHLALAALEQGWRGRGEFLLVTQNVDDLHERAGSRNVLHMHGQLRRLLCAECGAAGPWLNESGVETICPACDAAAMRPDIVWFGEIPYFMDEILEALARADVFCAIGTSGWCIRRPGSRLRRGETGAAACCMRSTRRRPGGVISTM
ncbi:NAD-dependent deacylase [Acidocella sp. MX-AZ03]|uniref:NAD-dependent deacylase n=1 Tax=Acidocella sp. MX-AZ03 TaxID=2697363 RepID=UPI002FD85B4C